MRTYDVATHEHCETTTGHVVCSHYTGEPVNGAIDGFNRLLDVWLEASKPDSFHLRCLA